MSPESARVVEIARGHQGKDSQAINQWYDSDHPDASWCARFVSWVFNEAGGPLPDMQKTHRDPRAQGFQSVEWAVGTAMEQGVWHEGTDGTRPGDVVVFDARPQPFR
ncbi:hypothetical protein [Nonomuraea insulae]|uniref:CHAP domain-containing protein n=1 Tax=Nonomuraea insulae TaxID=1616787 RepID=A0ABW1DBQ9_9ACTN